MRRQRVHREPIPERVLVLMKNEPRREWTVAQTRSHITGCRTGSISAALAKLAQDGKIFRVSPGRYSIIS